jgi:hypothetical protein
MKTHSKLNLVALALVAIIAVACKGKSSSSTSNSTVAESPKGNSVMDSLSITDPDERKVCALYDDAITDYMKEFKGLLIDTSKEAEARREALDKKWRDKEKEIQPQLEALRKKMVVNSTETVKFAQFSGYESRRLMSVIAEYQKLMMKNMQQAVPPTK